MKKLLVCFLVLAILLLTGCDDSIYRTGDVDYYYRQGYALSSVETTGHCVYSKDFVKKLEILDFSFHYYSDESQLLYPLGEYDASFISITYSDENYESAKHDLFANTEYISNEPKYVYNGYEFYIKPSVLNAQLFMNVFQGEKNRIILIGFYKDPTSDINLDVSEEEWPEFLRTYYGEYYDFDA